MRASGLALCLVLLLAGRSLGQEADNDSTDLDQSGFNSLRIENEDKLSLPLDKLDEVWAYMNQHYVQSPDILLRLGSGFSSSASEELFLDTYYDTPDLLMLAKKGGIRYRQRFSLSDPSDRKNGKALIQIKVNDISSNQLNRGEYKFPVRSKGATLIGMVKPDFQQEFIARVAQLGLSAYALRPIVTLKQRRRRVYILENGAPFLSISLDDVSSSRMFRQAHFAEIEPELNEIPYTQADPRTRASMEAVNKALVKDLELQFPFLQRDLAPKYSKAFSRLERKIPFYRRLIRLGIL